MEFDLEKTLEEIKSHPLFLRLKDVVENIDGSHNHEPVYDHCVKTAEIAKDVVKGDFIQNPEAKEKFTSWMGEDFHGMKKSDRTVIAALIHDCGKLLYLEEVVEKTSINLQKPDGQTACPGHEFWGGRLVAPELLKDLSLPEEVKRHICGVVKAHNAYGDTYFSLKKDWSIEEIVFDIKARADGFYEESLFNLYCDTYTSPKFADEKIKIEEVFNQPSFYIPRKYFIP